MTIYDISRDTGVSISTVSRVLNGKKGVGEKTRQKILDYMREHNFTPNALAQGLGTNTSKTIGIMCMDVADLYLATAVSTIERELRARGYDALLCCTGNDPAAQQGYLRMLLSKQVDALILVGSHYVLPKNYESIAAAAASVPVILINGWFRRENVYCVLMDDRELFREVTQTLLRAGRRRPLYLYDTLSYSSRQKLAGFRAALEEAGLSPDAGAAVQCPPGEADMRAFILALLRENHALADAAARFDGVLCMTDSLAIGVLKAAQELGIPVPRELCVVGCNNSVLATTCEPELSSIDNHIEALCITAIATLFGVLEGRGFPRKTILSGDLIRRGTTDF